MPICNHEEFKQLLKIGKKRKYEDENEKVFYCDLTKRIFREYEEYALHIIANSSTIWKCQFTGCENLTYSEALESEKLAIKSKRTLNENLRPVVLIFIKTVRHSSLKSLCNLSIEFIQNRFFVNERVKVLKKSHEKTPFVITKIKPKSIALHSAGKNSYTPNEVEYSIGIENENQFTVQFEDIERYKNSLNFTIIKNFIKKNAITIDNIIYPKPESYKKYVTDKKLSFDKLFIGKIPSVYNYERENFVKEKAMILCRQTDDLERFDQKELPKYEKVNTNIPSEYFGDLIMLSEFLQTFSKIHTYKNFGEKHVNLSKLTRAFTIREINGPLSSILINLLQTIFNLRKSEESEYPVWYEDIEESKLKIEPFKAMHEAYKTHLYITSHFCLKLNELPLNVYTLSEVLRLHFLSSGVQVKDATDMYRQMYRNGYSSKEDPGLIFRMDQSFVIDSLENLSVYQLPMPQIVQIINTLICQILTYSPAINMIENQMNRITQLRIELKDCCQLKKQQKRIQTRKDTTNINKIRKLSRSLFGFKTFLGVDRAYRKYYVLRSIPGVFVEHSPDCIQECLHNPPTNVPSFVNHPKQKCLTEKYLTRLYNKDRRIQKGQDKIFQKKNNELEENKMNSQIALGSNHIDFEKEETTINAVPSQSDLMMCTGDPTNCIVHNAKSPDRQWWSYFYTEEHIDAVIGSLNPYGDRESKLKKNLSMMRDLIVDNVKDCSKDNSSLNSLFTEHLTTHNIGLAEESNVNEELYNELRNQILKLKNHIISCNLKSSVEKNNSNIYLKEKLMSDVKLESSKFFEEKTPKKIPKLVKKLSLLLLDIKQSINGIYLRYQNHKEWEISLMASTSFSQVFLHLNILDRAILWSQ